VTRAVENEWFCDYCLQPLCRGTCPDKAEWDMLVRQIRAIHEAFPGIAEALRKRRVEKMGRPR